MVWFNNWFGRFMDLGQLAAYAISAAQWQGETPYVPPANATLVTLAEGEISELHVGLKSTMNALFLKDLAAKTHRGLRGRVEKGKAGGGLCYGYNGLTLRRLNSQLERLL